jgi:conserved hypothetical protein
METEAIKNRYDFIYLFDVQDGNPNGDPDGDNSPRTDYETGQGLVTDVCLKRKIRNYVEVLRDASYSRDNPRFTPERLACLKMFVREKAILNNTIVEEFEAANKGVSEKTQEDCTERARMQMCKYYYDVRTFGAVMSTGKEKEEKQGNNTEADGEGAKSAKNKKKDSSKIKKTAGQVRGAVQLTFARSVDPVVISEHTVTRMAVTDEKDKDKERTMGRKATVPYGLYRAHGFISAALARETTFSEDDLALLWEALKNMFDLDRSAARGLMAARRLIVFKHDSDLGYAPAHKLFELVKVEAKDPSRPARSFSDYEITVDESKLPKGVQLLDLI